MSVSQGVHVGPERSSDGVKKSYLGIDIGTSLTKAALFDENGELIGTAEQPTKLDHSAGGRVEQDVEDVVHSVGAVVRETLEHLAADAARPELVAVTGQGDGCWLVDADGRAVRPAVSWMDGRAGGLVGRWERNGVAEQVFRVNGNALFPGSQAAVLASLAADEPEALDRAATAQYCIGVVFQRLTGMRATDPSEASLPFGDVHGDYSPEVLRLTGLADRADLLPEVVRPIPVGTLSAEGAELTGLAEGTPVSAGPFDLPACALGAGISELGDGVLTVGTTLACQVLVDSVDSTGEPAGMLLKTPDPERFLRAMPAMVGTASLDWILNLVGMDVSHLADALSATDPGAGGVEVLPYFAPSGERAPFVDARARGQFTGLSLTTTREQLVRAVCEGIAFAARDCFERAGLTGDLFVCGGGTRSREWMQVFADVLGRPCRLARAAGIGARGAVLCHLRAVGEDPSPAVWTDTDEVVEPDPDHRELYDGLFERYRANQEAARPRWRDLD